MLASSLLQSYNYHKVYIVNHVARGYLGGPKTKKERIWEEIRPTSNLQQPPERCLVPRSY